MNPRIGIYTGAGASHSWLWFADLFDRVNFDHIIFMDEHDIRENSLVDFIDVLAVSGGDTFAVAEALGNAGARRIDSFVHGGGLYLGACAGAYLVMHSSLSPLSDFNFVRTKIANLAKNLPQTRIPSLKFATSYGCSHVYHPVRESVQLTTQEASPFPANHVFEAPLYGGPPMIPGPEVEVLARYTGFTRRTQFLVDEDTARSTLIDKAAVVRSGWGSGWFYLFGPHFEHPHFPEANRMLLEAIQFDMPCHWQGTSSGQESLGEGDRWEAAAIGHRQRTGSITPWRGRVKDLKREISNARIAAVSLEMNPVVWTIGQKVYEPLKIRVFLESIWNRIKTLEKISTPAGDSKDWTELVARARHITLLVREITRGVAGKEDTTAIAHTLFPELGRLAAGFLSLYFETKKLANACRRPNDPASEDSFDRAGVVERPEYSARSSN